MIYDKLHIADLDICIKSTILSTAQYTECHMVVSSISTSQPLAERMANAERAIEYFIAENSEYGLVPVFKRYYLSDPTNQWSLIPHYIDSSCAISAVGQCPAELDKFTILVILRGNVTVERDEHGLYAVRHPKYTEYWCAGDRSDYPTPYDATYEILSHYDYKLKEHGCSLADNCLRTWLFVRDIDNNYSGVVEGRNNMFEHVGLTRDTHFIASTGIQGTSWDPHCRVTFDAYAAAGISADDITYLKASDYLCPTAEYGVAFERGTSVRLPDGSRRILISGTASIDNQGHILHPHDISRQTQRMLQNVKALLLEAGASFDDVMHAVVYLRDPADIKVVKHILSQHLTNIPTIMVHAPVCRPGWLIEMECMALI